MAARLAAVGDIAAPGYNGHSSRSQHGTLCGAPHSFGGRGAAVEAGPNIAVSRAGGLGHNLWICTIDAECCGGSSHETGKQLCCHVVGLLGTCDILLMTMPIALVAMASSGYSATICSSADHTVQVEGVQQLSLSTSAYSISYFAVSFNSSGLLHFLFFSCLLLSLQLGGRFVCPGINCIFPLRLPVAVCD